MFSFTTTYGVVIDPFSRGIYLEKRTHPVEQSSRRTRVPFQCPSTMADGAARRRARGPRRRTGPLIIHRGCLSCGRRTAATIAITTPDAIWDARLAPSERLYIHNFCHAILHSNLTSLKTKLLIVSFAIRASISQTSISDVARPRRPARRAVSCSRPGSHADAFHFARRERRRLAFVYRRGRRTESFDCRRFLLSAIVIVGR
ncbi:hypothetical protein EVAR_64100_1 [Eumeta japonica]|uniref:Uncharacterized protein n=1 Tax=Eumeta variegata TaxID=151549 RepID=A0A4C1ZDW5_EUMVA|nr:hypothetical protein EVAR_64100_1 [Eumeta japonica]